MVTLSICLLGMHVSNGFVLFHAGIAGVLVLASYTELADSNNEDRLMEGWGNVSFPVNHGKTMYQRYIAQH